MRLASLRFRWHRARRYLLAGAGTRWTLVRWAEGARAAPPRSPWPWPWPSLHPSCGASVHASPARPAPCPMHALRRSQRSPKNSAAGRRSGLRAASEPPAPSPQPPAPRADEGAGAGADAADSESGTGNPTPGQGTWHLGTWAPGPGPWRRCGDRGGRRTQPRPPAALPLPLPRCLRPTPAPRAPRPSDVDPLPHARAPRTAHRAALDASRSGSRIPAALRTASTASRAAACDQGHRRRMPGARADPGTLSAQPPTLRL